MCGHRMRMGPCSWTHKLFKKDFFDEHRTFQYDTLYRSYEAEILPYETTVDFDYIQTDFQDLMNMRTTCKLCGKSIYQTKNRRVHR
ncbi:hypothetical protein ACEQPO_28815 [Bacillus sp. SL00103]